MKKAILFLGIFSFMGQVAAQNSLVGTWEGGITIPTGQLKIIFKIEAEGDELSGTLDIPQQGLKGLRFSSISKVEEKVELVFSAGQVTGTFSGVFESDSLIKGMYSQGSEIPFSVEKIEAENQEIVKPENETDFIIKNGAIEIGGTLTVPEGEINAPLLILSSGSGAQDRNSEVFEFKIFQLIAQDLAKKGIPSFRYDDRGVNKSTGSFADATLNDLVSDVDAIIKFFQTNEEQSFEEFTVLGHSQGGVVVGKIATENESVVQLILMGSTAPSLKEILRYQVELAYSSTPVDKELIEKEINAREDLMKSIVDEKEVEEAKNGYVLAYKNVLEGLPETQRNSIPDIGAAASNQVNLLVASFQNPQMKSLLFYVPIDDLEKVNIPVLVLAGGKDTQVTITQNLEPIREALERSGTKFEVKTFTEANHLFQKANNGSVNEYPFLKKAFVEGFTESIIEWMLSNQ